jgi:UDP-N-acetylglucosamine--N-acetylmuramyl-(pentapeptide) pyrophosphoryl-undecaprenol N-acetylglucosamine transferase
VDDHQTKNAQYLVDRGAATLLPQAHLTPEKLAQLLAELFGDEKVLIDMGNAASNAADKQATEKVAAFCQQLLKR